MLSENKYARRFGILCALAGVLLAVPASAQKNRIRAYHKQVEQRLSEKIESYRLDLLKAAEQKALEQAATQRTPAATRPAAEKNPDVARLSKPFAHTVNVHDSNDGDGQDVELRMTMRWRSRMQSRSRRATSRAMRTR